MRKETREAKKRNAGALAKAGWEPNIDQARELARLGYNAWTWDEEETWRKTNIAGRTITALQKTMHQDAQTARSPEFLDDYLEEFAFRINHRTARRPGKQFYRCMRWAVNDSWPERRTTDPPEFCSTV